MDFTAADGDRESRTLAVMIPARDYQELVTRSVLQTTFLMFLLAFALGFACRMFTRRYLSPLLRDLRKLTSENRGDGQINYNEVAAAGPEA